jgi:tetratricopeptide (TPR) repeat protein
MLELRRFSGVLLLIGLLASVPGVARAQEGEGAGAQAEGASARDLFLRGQAAYRQGDYATAAELWSQAYAMDPRPQLQYNLAQAYGRLGRMEEERAALERFIAETSPDDPLLAP